MGNTQSLTDQKFRLKAAMRMMNSDAGFESEEGRRYAEALVKLFFINLKIEAIDKKEAAQ